MTERKQRIQSKQKIKPGEIVKKRWIDQKKKKHVMDEWESRRTPKSDLFHYSIDELIFFFPRFL